ncbi:G-protein beta WD-40 repeat-containing protein [Cynara cardunculus var. scolymus]|uniref:G-protein beta WD-40 repeat-containing protein n=1 Tax=Cynara cardunculus var. scolymus TaxID=59895 RepID=A0A103Y4N0_CYNCS|nr:G-protein beta WD-40 repeat-containing protein [Cynara cardunculus var. scolymus]
MPILLECSLETLVFFADKARICEWLAHDNAIFDVCWIKIKLWDSEERKDLAVLTGHTGSVKSISAHPSNYDMIVSGSRDGSFALWDLRSSKLVPGAHSSNNKARGRHGKAASMSITSVLYLKDEVSIATAGAADSVVMFWDTRNLTAPVTKVWSHDNRPRKWSKYQVRSHGISSLSQDLNGVYISASCMDSRIYLYNVLRLEDGPVKSFSGCDISTFFVKSSLSPDAAHILSGSSDGNAYVWQVDKPQADPIKLNGHGGEVTAVDWCSSEIGKIATTADDSVVRLWNINTSCYSNTRSTSSIRRRLFALPKTDRTMLFTNEPEPDSPLEPLVQISSPNPSSNPEMRTPESLGKQSSKSYIREPCDGSPDATLGSPSSVLNPPPSLKRKTILDYFLAPS